MFVPASSGSALIVALLSMCCWGSWSNSLVFTKDVARFELYIVDFSLAMFPVALIFAVTLGMLSSSGKGGADSFTDDFDGHVDGIRFVYAMGAGLVWYIANLMLCKGIAMLGLALAFPLCIGTAMVLGTILTYAIQPSGNVTLLFSGVFVAFVAVCLAAFVHRLKEQQLQARTAWPEARQAGDSNGSGPAPLVGERGNQETSMTRKLSVCLVGGVLMSLFNPLVTLAEKDGGLSPYTEFIFFTLAALIASIALVPLILIFPIEGGKGVSLSAALQEYRRIPAIAHVIAAVGSAVWCLGTLTNAIAGDSGVLSSAESYSIGQCANMIAIFWGAFYFKEFEGTNSTVKLLLVLVVALYGVAIALVAASSG